jgi:hypothetical protein
MLADADTQKIFAGVQHEYYFIQSHLPVVASFHLPAVVSVECLLRSRM